jgi:hypothetical protein
MASCAFAISAKARKFMLSPSYDKGVVLAYDIANNTIRSDLSHERCVDTLVP